MSNAIILNSLLLTTMLVVVSEGRDALDSSLQRKHMPGVETRVSTQGRYLVFVGSAGCDRDDRDCARDTLKASTTVWGFDLTPDGRLEPALNASVPSLSIWLTTAPQLPNCLFAALVDDNKIAAFKVERFGLEQKGAPLPSGGKTPMHASITRDGGMLLVVNYDWQKLDAASVASFRIGDDCMLTSLDVVKHHGKSVVHGPQDSAHPHHVVQGRGGFVYVCDFGQDLIFTYALGRNGSLTELHRARATPSDGPRFLVEDPKQPFVYVVNELTNTITTYKQGDQGKLTTHSRASLLAPGASVKGTRAADITITRDGTTIYASTRGRHNTVCVFRVLEGGNLKQIQQISAPAFPRSLLLSPDGSVLLVAGQHLGVVESYRIGARGMLSKIIGGTVIATPTAATLAVVDRSSSCKASRCLANFRDLTV